MEFPEETTINKQCPTPTPILCGSRTLARGLCVATAAECEIRTLEKRETQTTKGSSEGEKYSYKPDNLGRGCYAPTANLKKDYDRVYTEFDSIPSLFSVVTYNIWGLATTPELKRLFTLRKDLLLETLRESESDCICIQEMSEYSYSHLESYIKEHRFASEIPYKFETERNRSADCYYISKYRPQRIVMYSIGGVLEYNNSLIVIEYPNLIIFNIYNQAGSKSSIGQQNVWIHYSRCRYDILNIIYDLIENTPAYKSNNVVICGDFNFHLDGDPKEWPEAEMMDKLYKCGFVDTYRQKNRGPGYTENTDLNLMRWNHKLVDKKYRYDAILYRPVRRSWKIHSSSLFGKKLGYLNAEDSNWFVDIITNSKSWSKMKGVTEISKERRIAINASDHFGVRTVFATEFRSPYTRNNRKYLRKTRSSR
jgi:exonuclease III